MINLQNLIDDAKCYETVRALRWPEGVRCPRCNAAQVTKQGHDTTQPARQKYHCAACKRYFDGSHGHCLWPPTISPCGSGFCACISWG
jgi:transposase-like protein